MIKYEEPIKGGSLIAKIGDEIICLSPSIMRYAELESDLKKYPYLEGQLLQLRNGVFVRITKQGFDLYREVG